MATTKLREWLLIEKRIGGGLPATLKDILYDWDTFQPWEPEQVLDRRDGASPTLGLPPS